jgi:hypothetical protein
MPAAEAHGMTSNNGAPSEAWTIPLHVILWTTMLVGFIMVWVVVLMH